ncbi:MAG: tetratricopeptide repeat protein [Bacteroidales bacterium]|nr:tetratricopeptide repeat protein [Bacteroidales bacterium]
MKKNTYLIMAMVVSLLITVGCKNKQEKALANIKSLEEQIFNKNTPAQEPATLQNMMEQYVSYADQFPDDSLSPEMMMRAADIAANLNQAGYAITLYSRVFDNYPDFSRKPEALFMIAFVNENNIGDWDLAKEKYELFIQQYPDHPLTESAKICLQNLGVSAEDMILQLMQQQDSVSKQ